MMKYHFGIRHSVFIIRYLNKSGLVRSSPDQTNPRKEEQYRNDTHNSQRGKMSTMLYDSDTCVN